MGEHEIHGRWYVVSHDNLYNLTTAIGLAKEQREKVMSVFTQTGEDGLVMIWQVDLAHNALRRRMYINNQLMREMTVPLGQPVPHWSSVSNSLIQLTVNSVGTNKITFAEVFEVQRTNATADFEVNGDTMTFTAKCGDVKGSLTFNKSQRPMI